MSIDGSNKAYGGQLLLQFQDAPDDSSATPKVTKALGMIETATVEQSGPIRAVGASFSFFSHFDRRCH